MCVGGVVPFSPALPVSRWHSSAYRYELGWPGIAILLVRRFLRHLEVLRLEVSISLFLSLRRFCRRWNSRNPSWFHKNKNEEKIERPCLFVKRGIYVDIRVYQVYYSPKSLSCGFRSNSLCVLFETWRIDRSPHRLIRCSSEGMACIRYPIQS